MIAIRDRVRFVETDMMGVVHHANYLRWFEMGRVAYLRAAGVELLDLMAHGVIFPITEVHVKYKNSCTFDDEFEVQTIMTEFSRAKMDFAYKVIRLADGVVLVEGRTRNLFTNQQGKIILIKSMRCFSRKQPRSEKMETKFEIVPVPTRILTHHDDIVEAIVEYGGDKIGPDDVVCVAESVVAITQGGAKRSEDFKPGLLAKVLCRLFPSKGSISGWHSMQALIDAEGGMRVLIAVICGFAAKCVGVSGVFYRMAGEQARLIDDVTGTMPPYDKHIVYGPHNPSKVAEEIASGTGAFGAAVADVNDLKRSCVLGVSKGVNADEVAQILIDNPFGNGSQKTPVVVIKNYRRAR